MRLARSELALLLLGGAGAIAWGVSGWQVAHPSLERDLERAMARAFSVEPDAVSVKSAALAWPARLVIDEPATGDWAAARVEVAADPWALLGGRLRVERVRAQELVSEAGTVGELEATVGAGRARVALRRVTVFPVEHWLGGLSVAEIGAEIEDGTLRRLAFSGGRVAGVGELSGAASRAPDGGWLLRGARPGVTATAHLDGDGLAGQAHLERLALAELPAPRGVSGRASGTVTFAADGEGARATAHLALEDVTVDHPRVARRPLTGLRLTVDGELALDDGALMARALRLGVGRASVVLDGNLVPGGSFELAATLPTIGCADLLASLPRALIPHLDGLLVDGELGGRVRLAGFADDPGALTLAVDGNLGCRTRADAALADVAALAKADPRAIVATRNPSWRPLASLPPPLVRAFLVAEDGHFFMHHGFDVERIGHALAADLEAGRFDRGASTITQQVAKNLWLDGERTLGRKLEEAVLTWRVEHVLDKRRILELYVNLVELGPGVYGVEDAAAKYFGKLPDGLTADEAAQLAALLPAPRRGMDAAWERRYRALAARMPLEKVPMPPVASPPAVKLSIR